jgi:uncharacterized membrane protein YkvA (DUF1232 family)
MNQGRERRKMAIIPKPKTQGGQILVFLSGIFAAILGFFYIVNKIDVIPDGLGPLGYLDDLVMVILIVFFTNRFFKRFGARVSKNKAAYKEMWRKGDLVKLMVQPKTWGIVLVLAGVFAYFFWSLDAIPDVVVGLGWVDDALAAVGALVIILRMYAGGKKK